MTSGMTSQNCFPCARLKFNGLRAIENEFVVSSPFTAHTFAHGGQQLRPGISMLAFSRVLLCTLPRLSRCNCKCIADFFAVNLPARSFYLHCLTRAGAAGQSERQNVLQKIAVLRFHPCLDSPASQSLGQSNILYANAPWLCSFLETTSLFSDSPPSSLFLCNTHFLAVNSERGTIQR